MAWPAYSTAFVRATDVDVWHEFTVPNGKRAVVKSVTSVCFAQGDGTLAVTVAGIYLVFRTFPAPYTTLTLETMAVAYAGEKIAAANATRQYHTIVSGYLLDDPQGAAAGYGPETTREIARGELLPAGGELAGAG